MTDTLSDKEDKVKVKSVIDVNIGKYNKAEIEVLIDHVRRSSKFKPIVLSVIPLLKLFQNDARVNGADRFRKTREEALERIEQEKELFNQFSEEWFSSNYGRAKLAGHVFWDWKQQKMIPFIE